MTAALRKKFRRYLIFLQVGWFALVVTIAALAIQSAFRQAEEFALATAEESLQKDMTYRRWNAGHGGVYVPVTETTQPNPYLQVPNRELHTIEGMTLTKINPAYMTRQVHELARQPFGSRGHITSLNPLRPENSPDPWEADALRRIDKSRKRHFGIVEDKGEKYLRAMIPLVAEEGCLTCHAAQGYQKGDLRGGLSTTIPMSPYLKEARRESATVIVLGLLLWLSGGAAITIGGRNLRSSIDRHLAAELALRESEQRFSDLVNSTDGVVWEYDIETCSFTFVSRFAETLLGYPLKEWYRVRFWEEHIHPEDRSWAVDFCTSQTREMNNHTFEYRFRRVDGTYIWLRDLVTVVKEGSAPKSLRGIMIDVTHERDVLMDLQQYQAVVESSDKLICAVDRDYRYVLVNDKFLTYQQKSRNEVVGHSAEEVLGVESFNLIKPSIDRCLAGESIRFEMEREYPVIGNRTLEVIYRPVGTGGPNPRVASVISDITEAKRLAFELEETVRVAEAATASKDIFLANMSHEIRTPLNGLLGMLQLLDDSSLDAEHAEYLNLATRSGWNLLGLLDDILDISRIEAGALELYEEPFDLHELLESMLVNFAGDIALKGINYQLDLKPSLPRTVRGDERRIRQILYNLIGNAVKFTDEGGITLSAGLSERELNGRRMIGLTVSDTGIGMNVEILESLFAPFVQGDSTYRKRYQGAGLGLSIVRRLVESMHGTIDVQSVPAGGTIFEICLPLEILGTPQISREVQEEKPNPDVCSGMRVLVAEDNEVNALMVVKMLQKEGCEVIRVADGEQARERGSSELFDLILMDIQMPVLSGVQATKMIRKEERSSGRGRVPIIALTAYAMPGDRDTFIAAGMDDYLAKPVSFATLRELLMRYRGERS